MSASISPDSALLIVKLQLAAQVAPRRWQRCIRDFQAEIRSGVNASEAAESLTRRCPVELQSIVGAAFQLPDPGEFLLVCCRTRAESQRRVGRLLNQLAYPVILLLATIAFCTSFIWIIYELAARPGSILSAFDYGEETTRIRENLEMQWLAMSALSCFVFWGLLVWAVLYFLPPRWVRFAVASGIPLFGRTLRSVALIELLNRVDTVTKQGLDTSSALSLVAKSLRGAGLQQAGRQLVERVSAGLPMGLALTRSQLADDLLVPILLEIDHREDATCVSADIQTLLSRGAEDTLKILGSVAPLLMFLIVGAVVSNTVATAMETIYLIRSWFFWW